VTDQPLSLAPDRELTVVASDDNEGTIR